MNARAVLFACRPPAPVATLAPPVVELASPRPLSLPVGAGASTPAFFSADNGDLLMSFTS